MIKLKLRLLFCLLTGVILSARFGAETATAQTRLDSLRLSPLDSTLSPTTRDTTQGAQTDTVKRKRDIETTVKYNARDSVVLDVDGKIARLYGEAQIDYGDVSLSAAFIEINWATSIVDARGVPDSTGKPTGQPVFKDAGQTYTTESMRYNIKTRKASISGVVTQQGEGYVHGTRVFKDPEDNLYVGHAKYTTCNLPHPHFFISAPKIKVVKDKQIVSGPFNLVIADIPTPLGFAFGMFPYSNTRKSGIIFPQYGEEPRNRGFFLRNGGYYWAVSDNISLSFLGEIYSRGSWGLNMRSQYVKRYAYNGNFDIRFNRRKSGDEGSSETIAEDFWIAWSHVPFSKGTGRFSASVNAGTSKFNARNAIGYGAPVGSSTYGNTTNSDLYRRISPAFNSNISYSNVVRGLPINYSINARHDMNTTTGIMNLTLPDMNLSVNRLYPFKGKRSTGKYFWETLSLAYNFNASNRLTNTPKIASNSTLQGLRVANASTVAGDTIGFNFANAGELWRRADISARHSIPISMSMKLFKYFSLNYSFSYNENWYPQKYNFTYNPADQTINIDTLRGLSRNYSYNAGAGLTTNIYGTFFINRGRWVAMRHRMVPNVGFSFTPDFSRDRYGFYQSIYLAPAYVYNPANYPREYFSRFQNAASRGQSGSITFSLNNTLEAKLKAKDDTTTKSGEKGKERFEKISLLDQFGFSTSYNLVADSFKLQPINFNVRTRLFQKVDISFTSTVDPYTTVEYTSPGAVGGVLQRQVSIYAWARRPQRTENDNIIRYSRRNFGQITFANLSFSTNFNPEANKKKNQKQGQPDQNQPLNSTNPNLPEETRDQLRQIEANKDAYVDFTIPWSLNVSYNLSYSKRGFDKPNTAQALTFNGDLKVTDKWKVGFTSSYDLQARKISDITTINIYRDLHCWDMTFNWTPFGRFQSYSFDLKVKAALLQDLKLSRRRGYSQGGAF